MLIKGRNSLLRMIGAGSAASMLLSFVLALLLTPTAVHWQGEHPQVTPIPAAAYWFHVAGIMVWFTILGVITSCLLAAVMIWRMRGKEEG